MATKVWKGGAQAIAQVTSVTWSAYTSGVTYSVTINNKSIEFTATASTFANVVDGIVAAIEAAAEVEFSQLTPSNSGSALVLTGNNPGEPATITAGSDGAPTATVTATVAATGPNHFDNADNWEGGVAPVAADDIVFRNSTYSVLYGLVDTGDNYGDITVESTFTGEIGLPVQNPLGYREYRPRFLKLGDGSSPFAVTIGIGNGGQPSRVFLDFNGAEVTARVYGSGAGTIDESPIIFKNPGDNTIADIYSGKVDIDADSSGTLSSLKITPADTGNNLSVLVSERVNAGQIIHGGGALEVRGSASSIDCTSNATARFVLDSTCPIVVASKGGTVFWESTQNISTRLTAQSGGTVDFSRNATPKSILYAECFQGGTILDPLAACIWLGGILLDGCSVDDVTIDLGRGKTIFTTLVKTGYHVMATNQANFDLTSVVTVLTATPDPLAMRICRVMITLGDGVDDLDGNGGAFEVSVIIDGVLWNGEADTILLGEVEQAIIQTNDFVVPANKEVIVRVLSPNAADTDVNVTTYLVSEG